MSWLRDWKYRIKFVVDSTKIDEVLQDFPVKIQLTSEHSHLFHNIDTTSNAKIAVISSGKQCYVEIEYWDSSINCATIWVNIPYISDNEVTEFYLYYDSSKPDNTQFIGNTGSTTAENVWDSNYIAVWHLAQDPTGGSDCILDSTYNSNDGTPQGSMVSSDLVNSISGKAIKFDGSNDYINISDNSIWTMGDDSFTLEFLVKHIGAPTGSTSCLSHHQNSYLGWHCGYNSSTFEPYFKAGNSGSSPWTISLAATTNINDGNWHNYAMVRDGTSWKLYIDGNLEDSQTTTLTLSDFSIPINIGGQETHGLYTNCYITDVRITKGVSRSEAWLSASVYNTINELMSSTIESKFGGWKDSFNMTIDHNKIDEDLIDFPIRINTANLGGYNANDITDTFDQLDVDPNLYDQHTVLQLHGNGDLSNSRHTLTFHEELEVHSNGPFYESYYFDGSNNYISMSDSTNWDLNDDFTIDFYLNLSTIQTSELISCGAWSGWLGAGKYGWGLVYSITAGLGWHYQNDNTTIFQMDESWTATADTWYHVALTRSDSSIKMFIDGIQIGNSNSSSDVFLCQTDLFIGRASLLAGSPLYTHGYMSNIRITKGKSLWTSNFTPPTKWTPDEYTVFLLNASGDKSKSGHSITFNNEPEIHADIARFDGSYYFDGTDDYIEIPDSEDWNFGSEDFTIELYFRLSILNDTHILISNWESGTSSNQSWQLYITSSNTLYFSGNEGVTSLIAIESSTTVEANRWYHVAASRKGSTAYLFLDGILENEDASSSGTLNNSSVDVLLGAQWNNGATSGFHYMNGYLAEIRVSKGIARYISNFTPPTSKFVDPDVNTVLMLTADGDESDSQHIISLNNGSMIYSDQNTPSRNAYYFDGTDDYISIPNSSDFNLSSGVFTIDFWTYFPDSGSSSDPLISRANSSLPYDGWYIYRHSNTWMSFVTGDNAGLTDSSSIIQDVWQHWAFVYDGSTMRQYCDGTLVDTASRAIQNRETDLWIGHSQVPGVDYSKFYISELRISKGIMRWTSNFTPDTIPYEPDQYTKLLLQPKGDSSNFGNTLTYNSSVKNYATGKFEGSYYFNGSSDYITIPDSDVFDFGTDDFTIDLWFWCSNTAPEKAVIEKGYWDAGVNEGWLLRVDEFGSNSRRVRFVVSDNQVATYSHYSTTSAFTVETWTHIAVIRSNGSINIYVNGNEITTDTESGDPTASIGGNNEVINIGNASSSYFDGYLSDIRITKGKSLWTSNFTPPGSPFNRNWVNRNKLSLTTNNDVYDSYDVLRLPSINDESWSQHNLSFINEPKLCTENIPFEEAKPFFFNGINDYITIPNSDDFNFDTNDFTIEAWIYRSSTESLSMLLNQRDDDTHLWGFGINHAGGGVYVPNFRFINGASSISISGSSQVGIGWMHIAAVRSGNTFTIYKDGEYISSDTSSSSMPSLSADLHIGRYYSGTWYYFNGGASNIRISKGIARYTSNFTQPTELFIPDYATILLLNNKNLLVEFNNYNDNFNGVDGSTPRTDLWNTTSGNGIIKIYDNKLTSYCHISQTDPSAWLRSNYNIEGDFDIQIDYELIQYSNINHWSTGLYVWDHVDSKRFHIARHYNTSYGNNSYLASSYNTSSGWSRQLTSTSDTSGKLRIVRKSGSFKVYFYSSTGWTDAGTISNSSTNPVQINIYSMTGNNKPTFEVHHDNFKFNNYVNFIGGIGDSTEGIFNSSYYFDGIDDHLVIPSSNSWQLEDKDFTIDFWFKSTNVSDHRGFIGTRNTSEDYGYSIEIDYDGSNHVIRPHIVFSDDSANNPHGVTPIVINTWYHVAFVRNSSSFKLYLNGKLETSFTSSKSIKSVSNLYIGTIREDAFICFSGYISNFRITKGIARWTTNFNPPSSSIEVEETQLPIEIEDWKYNDKEATLWTKVPFVSSIVDTPINLYYDNSEEDQGLITIEDASDDFTGTSINKGLWRTTASWQSNPNICIYDNSLRFQADSVNTFNYFFSNFKLKGNFDIQVDFNLVDLDTTDKSYFGFRVNSGAGPYQWRIQHYTSTTRRYNCSSKYSTDPTWESTIMPTTETSGIFRITRTSDDTFNFYFKEPGDTTWTLCTDSPSPLTFTGDVEVWFYSGSSGSYPTIKTDFNNFKINTADGIIDGGYTGETGSVSAQQVWNLDYVGIWHMNQEPVGTDSILDSTINANHGTSGGSMTSDDLVDGKIGKAINFDGSDDRITPVNDYGDADTDVLFLEALIRSTNHSIGQVIIARIQGVSPSGYYGWSLNVSNTGKIGFGSDQSQVETRNIYSDNAIKLNDWSYVVGTKETGTSADMTLFIDGIKQIDIDSSVSGTTHVNNATIGWNSYSSNAPYYGDICEIRFSNIVRSDAWIKATYYSLWDELLRMGPGWKYVLNDSDNLILRRIKKINNIPLENIGTVNRRSR